MKKEARNFCLLGCALANAWARRARYGFAITAALYVAQIGVITAARFRPGPCKILQTSILLNGQTHCLDDGEAWALFLLFVATPFAALCTAATLVAWLISRVVNRQTR